MTELHGYFTTMTGFAVFVLVLVSLVASFANYLQSRKYHNDQVKEYRRVVKNLRDD